MTKQAYEQSLWALGFMTPIKAYSLPKVKELAPLGHHSAHPGSWSDLGREPPRMF